MIFRNVRGMWRRVDSQEPQIPTLAEVLEELHIIIDDSTQFCRIIRYFEEYQQTITYRAYSMAKVVITINENPYK